MADIRNYQGDRSMAAGRAGVAIDEGLRAYMLKVYNYMALAVAITGIVALGVANMAQSNPAFAQALYGSPLKWVVMLAPLAFVLVLSFGINKLSAGAAQALFWVYSAVMGLSISSIFLVFTGQSIAQTFFVTAAAFAGLSLYGYTTKRDLSAMGKFLIMGLIGIIIASIVNIFLGSSALQFAVNVIGVLVFAGLIAYDTQRIKEEYDYIAHDGTAMQKGAIMSALSLYLNFVNLFMFLLQFMGDRE
ncbi:MAG: Bax inhibitor-1/YccA family protein [Pseudomonadota bacterium]